MSLDSIGHSCGQLVHISAIFQTKKCCNVESCWNRLELECRGVMNRHYTHLLEFGLYLQVYLAHIGLSVSIFSCDICIDSQIVNNGTVQWLLPQHGN